MEGNFVQGLGISGENYRRAIFSRVLNPEKALENNRNYYEKLFDLYEKTELGEEKDELREELFYLTDQERILKRLVKNKTSPSMNPLISEEAGLSMDRAIDSGEWRDAMIHLNRLYSEIYKDYKDATDISKKRIIASRLEILLGIVLKIQTQLNSNGGTA